MALRPLPFDMARAELGRKQSRRSQWGGEREGARAQRWSLMCEVINLLSWGSVKAVMGYKCNV